MIISKYRTRTARCVCRASTRLLSHCWFLPDDFARCWHVWLSKLWMHREPLQRTRSALRTGTCCLRENQCRATDQENRTCCCIIGFWLFAVAPQQIQAAWSCVTFVVLSCLLAKIDKSMFFFPAVGTIVGFYGLQHSPCCFNLTYEFSFLHFVFFILFWCVTTCDYFCWMNTVFVLPPVRDLFPYSFLYKCDVQTLNPTSQNENTLLLTLCPAVKGDTLLIFRFMFFYFRLLTG